MEEKKTAIPAILALVFLFTIEISFTYSVWLNIYVLLMVVAYLAVKTIWCTGIFISPTFYYAITTFWSVYIQGSGLDDAWVLFTRTYAFAALGIGFMVAVDLQDCLLILNSIKCRLFLSMACWS